jgi:hypothetical protein
MNRGKNRDSFYADPRIVNSAEKHTSRTRFSGLCRKTMQRRTSA